MAVERTKMTTIRLDLGLADLARRALGAKSRTEAVRRALAEVVYTGPLQTHHAEVRGEAHV